VVVTGIDRPIPSPKSHPVFFGKPSDLPMHSVYLATKTHVPVIVMATIRLPDGKCSIYTSDPIEMDGSAGEDRDILQNAEKVLRIGEDFIRQAPNQWSISLPVWPDKMELVFT
jgi:lauroyl/myristoyl acyltransferase